MNEDKVVGADAHIPSDTEPFEQNAAMFRKHRPPTVSEQVRQWRDKIYEDFNNFTKRVSSYVQFHIQNDTEEAEKVYVGPRMLAIDTYVNLRILIARQEFMMEYLEKEHGIRIPNFEMLEAVNKKLEESLKGWEETYGIDIRPEGVRVKGAENTGNVNDGASGDDNRNVAEQG